MLARIKWIGVSACLLTILLAQCARRPLSYQSTNPENEYVGTQACQPCHQRVYNSYIQTGMGKSLYAPSPDQIIERFDSATVVYDPRHDFYYEAYWEGENMFIREFRIKGLDTTHQRREKVDYVVGSGHQTRSYLMERNGYWFEMPVTWYVNRQIWDLSPGYDVQNSRFDREIGAACLACHTGYIDYIEGSKNRYRFVSQGIDCEKCHGPGAIHIREMQSGTEVDVGEHIDYSIVNPAKLPINAQFDVCQQCHLQGINVPQNGLS
ncbi:MAG: multiheme c-type cytochrome, partial [Bacteroidota bacterium]